jgi:hypothetical protein
MNYGVLPARRRFTAAFFLQEKERRRSRMGRTPSHQKYPTVLPRMITAASANMPPTIDTMTMSR